MAAAAFGENTGKLEVVSSPVRSRAQSLRDATRRLFPLCRRLLSFSLTQRYISFSIDGTATAPRGAFRRPALLILCVFHFKKCVSHLKHSFVCLVLVRWSSCLY